MYEPGRTGKHEHPYYLLHDSCHTPEHRTQTLTCRDLNPDTAYILHYMYSYLTQGQQEQALIAMSPKVKHIISEGIGVYATLILQPTTPVGHLTTGLAIYAYLPMNPCRLPEPSPAELLFFTDASGKSAPTPITGGATLQPTHTEGHYHIDHHTGHTTYGASSQGWLEAIADAIAETATHLPAHLPHVVRVWFVVDATVDTHLLLRIARQPLNKFTATSLGNQALLLWKALCSLPPYVQLNIVKQESHRHQYGNGKVNIEAVHQRTTHQKKVARARRSGKYHYQRLLKTMKIQLIRPSRCSPLQIKDKKCNMDQNMYTPLRTRFQLTVVFVPAPPTVHLCPSASDCSSPTTYTPQPSTAEHHYH